PGGRRPGHRRDILFALAQYAREARGRQRGDDAGHAASLSRRLGPRLRPHSARSADRIARRRFRLNAHEAFAHDVTGEQRGAEKQDDERSCRFQSAQQKHAGAGPRLGKPVGQPARANRQRRDGRNSDRRAQSHDKGRRDADPEQSLGQGEDKDDDRPRARPQANRDDRGKTAPEPMLARQFLWLRRVRVTPGRCIVVMVMIVRMAMAMMVVTVVVPMVVIVRVIMTMMVVVRMVMMAMAVVVAVVMVVRVLVMAMVVHVMLVAFRT